MNHTVLDDWGCMAPTGEDAKAAYQASRIAKSAEKNRERARLYAIKHRAEHPEQYAAAKRRYAKKQRTLYPERMKERYRRWNLKTFYDMTPEGYAAKLAAQDGGCAICTKADPGGRGRFHVDHDHTSGKVRDLLCHNCNVALGNFKDDLSILAAALAYLTRHKNSDPMPPERTSD